MMVNKDQQKSILGKKKLIYLGFKKIVHEL